MVALTTAVETGPAWIDETRGKDLEEIEKEGTLPRQGCQPLWIQGRMDILHWCVPSPILEV